MDNLLLPLYAIIGLLIVVIVLLLFIILRQYWAEWEGTARVVALAVVALAGLVYLRYVEADRFGVNPTAALDLWRRWDGWTRSHSWVGMLLMAALVVVFLMGEENEEEAV